jgi:hypothetical protein
VEQNDSLLQDRISFVQRLTQYQTQIWKNVYDMNRQDPLIGVLPTIAPIWGHVDERTRQIVLTGVVRSLIHDITPHLVTGIVGAINENYNESNPAQQHLDNQDRDAFLPQAIQLTIEAMAPTIAAATATAVQALRRDSVDHLKYSNASTGQYLSPASSPQPPAPSPPQPPASSPSPPQPPASSPQPNPFVITESIQSPRSWLPRSISPNWNYTHPWMWIWMDNKLDRRENHSVAKPNHRQGREAGEKQNPRAKNAIGSSINGKAITAIKNNAQINVLFLVNCVVGGLLPEPNSRFTRSRIIRQSFYWSGQ